MRRIGWAVVVQSVVLAAWVFFRSESFSGAVRFVGNIAALDFGPFPVWALASVVFILPIAWLHAWTWFEEQKWSEPSFLPARAALTAAMLFAIMALGGQGSAFIYFQF